MIAYCLAMLCVAPAFVGGVLALALGYDVVMWRRGGPRPSWWRDDA